MPNKCTSFAPSPKHNSFTSLLVRHSLLCLMLMNNKPINLVRPELLGTLQWRWHSNSGEIFFVIPVCPFHSLNFMFFAKKWQFDGGFYLTDVLECSTMCCFPHFWSRCYVENGFTDWMVVLCYFSLNYENHWKFFSSANFWVFFLQFFSKKNKCVNYS